MKSCPACGRLYPEDAGFCPVDGSSLVSASQTPPPVDLTDARIGSTLFQRYQFRRIVADGGMGRVYEALDLVDQRNVAIKVLHDEVARDPVQVERFKREFEVSKQLPHDHIVEVLDFAELVNADGSSGYMIVMEFLYGEELRSLLDRERVIKPARAVRMLSQVAVGLDEAHAGKLVHRDLKPDNIFLCQTPEGDTVKLLDFGSVRDNKLGAKKLTMMGTTIGSPYYMAPEQAQGLDTLDHRADIWALGAILYEALCGKVPFGGANGPQILLAIMSREPISVSEVALASGEEVPPTLDPVLAKTFKKIASLRFERVGDFADAFGHAFGLSGDHSDWATMPEAELASVVRASLPDLMSQPALAVASVPTERSEADSFFGENDALGEADSTLAAGRRSPDSDPMAAAMRAAHVAPSEAPENYQLPGTRRGTTPAWVFAVVALIVLVLLLLLFI